MSSPLDSAVAGAAALLGRPDVAASVERVEVRPPATLVLTVLDGTHRRWLRHAEGEIAEIRPEDDAELALARRLRGAPAAGVPPILSYRPGRRVVLEGMSGDRAAVLKGYRRGKPIAALAAHRIAEETNAKGAFLVPRLLEFRPAEDALVFERVAGPSLPLDRPANGLFLRIGERLAAFQAAGAGDEVPLFRPADELAVLDQWAARVEWATGGLPAGWSEGRARLGARAAEAETPEIALSHRDLHDRQMLLTSRGVALLDFDLLCRADPALDVANLLVHLRLRALQGLVAGGAAGAAARGEELLAGLGRRDREFLARLRFYEASSCLRLSLVYGIRPRWRHLSPALVEMGQHFLLDGQRAPSPP
ncbi:MAG: aminoglycoside phosphotransferase family protein [Planctomycetota bacterium]